MTITKYYTSYFKSHTELDSSTVSSWVSTFKFDYNSNGDLITNIENKHFQSIEEFNSQKWFIIENQEITYIYDNPQKKYTAKTIGVFKKNLKEIILKSEMDYPNPKDLTSIIVLKNDTSLIQVVSCNDFYKDSINDGCIMSWMSFDYQNKHDEKVKKNFLLSSISKEFKYQFSDMDLYYKNHSYNIDECIELVIKVLKDFYLIDNYF